MREFMNRFILLRNINLQSRLMIYFSLLIIMPLYIVASVTYQSAERTIEQNASEYSSSNLQQAINSVDLYIENADHLMQSLFFDDHLIQYILDGSKSDYDRYVSITAGQKILKGYILPAKYIAQLYIVDLKGNVYASDAVDPESLKIEAWYNQFAEGKEDRAIVSTHDVKNYFSRVGSADTEVISILRKYTYIEKNSPLGMIGIDINYDYICDIFKESQTNEWMRTIMLSEHGEIIYDQDEALVGTFIDKSTYLPIFDHNKGSYIQEIEGVTYFIVFTTSNKTNWKLIQLIPTDELFAEANKIKTNTFYVGFICIVIALLISVGVSYGVSRPLKRLGDEMEKVTKGDLNVHMDITSHDEIGALSQNFNKMAEELSASIDKIYADENIKRQIELHMLQQQINPHFLFNTLDSINWMARMQNAPKISTIITSLVKLLQASTYTDSDFVKISDEIENVKNYITIQKFRYGSRFEVVYDMDENIMDTYTLKLILQPLVENAIYHGLEDVSEGGMIVISGRRMGDSLYLSVEDNGKGIDLEKVHQILLQDNKVSQRFSSIGISNTTKRIKLYYGEDYGLELQRLDQGGTRSVINIPVRLEERMKIDDQSDDCR